MESLICDNNNTWRHISKSSAQIIAYTLNNRKIFNATDSCDYRTRTIAALSHRILRNLRGIHTMALGAEKSGDSTLLKLPVGLVLRNCLLDCIIALHVASGDNDRCKNFIALTNRNYVNALFEQYEVYRDKQTVPFDDVTTEHMYTMAIEDTYLDELTVNDKISTISPHNERYMWRAGDIKNLYDGCKRTDAEIKSITNSMVNDKEIGELVRTLYAYYKYFSQYEHYSQRGDGDSLADFGNDNVRLTKAFDHINATLHHLVSTLSSQQH